MINVKSNQFTNRFALPNLAKVRMFGEIACRLYVIAIASFAQMPMERRWVVALAPFMSV